MPTFDEEFTVKATADAVWDFFLDPRRLASCLPGCESLEVEDATTYRVRLTVKVGFLSTTQNLRVTIIESERPRRLVSVGRGEDRKLASQVEDHPAALDAVMKVKARQLAGEFAANVRAAIEKPA